MGLIRATWLCVFLFTESAAWGAVHKLSLPQALEIAARNNPDILLARLDAERSRHDIEIARDAFSPKVQIRSDDVYTYGYPNAIGPNNDSPALLGQRTDMSLYNRPQHYQVAAAKQDAVTAAISPKAKADDIARQIASLYLDVEATTREIEDVDAQTNSFRNMESAVAAQIDAGYALPVELTRSKLQTAQNLQRLHALEDDQQYFESLLAIALGFSGNDSVEPVEQMESLRLPPFDSEEEAAQQALVNSKEMMRLQSGLLAKRLERKSYMAVRLPQSDLVEQYSLFAKETYEGYFPSANFQRNNAQLGASFTLPILIGLEPGARLQQADVDEEKLQIQMDDLGRRIRSNIHRGYQELANAKNTLDLAHQQLGLAHDQVDLTNAQFTEGRSSFADRERALNAQLERQLAVSQAEIGVQRAYLSLLEQTGNLLSTLLNGQKQSALSINAGR